MDELIEQFAIEARELVQQASDDLLWLESNPGDRARLESAFRAFHTLKGSVGLFDFGPMLGLLHDAEDLLSQARAGDIAVDADLIDPLLAVIEWVDDSIEGISRTGHLSEAQEQQAARVRGTLIRDKPAEAAASLATAQMATPDWAADFMRCLPTSATDDPVVLIRYEPHPECFFNGDDPLATISRVPELVTVRLFWRGETPAPDDFDPFRCNLVIEAVSRGTPAEAEAVFRLIPDQVQIIAWRTGGDTPASGGGALATQTMSGPRLTVMRVESTRIDRLVEIAGELIAAKNGLAALADAALDAGSGALAKRIAESHLDIERLVSALHRAVTQARMIPLEQTFRRFPRLVRETAARLGKTIDLIIEGETVEADREIVERLSEPLLHLVRNGLDHGLEAEAERLALGKPARGRIVLRARQHDDGVEIEVSDDGRGMDAEQIRNTAMERGLVSATMAATLSESEVLQLVFAAGFSTAASVSDLSGRGVGLDVVQRSIQELGGSIALRTNPGSGTSFLLTLPVSFSMKQLMVVEVGSERYGIPISDVIETVKLPAGAIQPIQTGRAFVLRDRTIPLVHLADLLHTPSASSSSGDLKVVIVRAGEDEIGLIVDVIAERTETLMRPMSGLLNGIAGLAGTTLLGDGNVLLVLNVQELTE